jgi:Alw26I/Eco31I/Esp3I family type II restriction m6 adenine DNA methyltransferase
MIEAILSTIRGDAKAYAGKTLSERVAGKFYTPEPIAADLAKSLMDAWRRTSRPQQNTISLCDPFGGDGRLIVAFMTEANKQARFAGSEWRVTVCDVDADAIRSAQSNIRNAAKRLGFKLKLTAAVGDSFFRRWCPEYDIVITNPPWELLKPDIRELAGLSPRAKAAHIKNLREVCDAIDAKFPEATAPKAWGGWGTNLARCGWALSHRLVKPSGLIGIVLPSTLLADQASVEVRRIAFTQARLTNIASYAPEQRLFAKVDQPVVAASFIKELHEMGVQAALGSGSDQHAVSLRLSAAELEEREYALPVTFGARSLELLSALRNLPKLQDVSGEGGALWTGRELDETRVQEKLSKGCKHPFIKGRMVKRHGLVEVPCTSVLDKHAVGLNSTKFERIVWRDVARASQQRRIIATIIPPGWVAGNSLHVAHVGNDDPELLRALYAVLSSFVFELQVRTRLATGHISLGIVRGARVPFIDGRNKRKLASLAQKALKTGDDCGLEVEVAKQYGMSRDMMASVLDAFPKIDLSQRERILQSRAWC